MFENLSDRLPDIAHKIKGYGKITEDNISDAEVVLLLEISLAKADVILCRCGSTIRIRPCQG